MLRGGWGAVGWGGVLLTSFANALDATRWIGWLRLYPCTERFDFGSYTFIVFG